jgi:hypothetical protein
MEIARGTDDHLMLPQAIAAAGTDPGKYEAYEIVQQGHKKPGLRYFRLSNKKLTFPKMSSFNFFIGQFPKGDRML